MSNGWFNSAHCEREDCDTWSRTPQAHGFISVRWGEALILYCSVDCMLQDMSRRSEPTETFDA